MILFSIPVHENVEVILDQIANYRRFAPDSGIVLHIARQFYQSSPDISRLRNLENVWINPDPLYTGFGLVLKCHISNFLFAKKLGISFSHFCLHASNDLFVRSGVEAYVVQNDFGFCQWQVSDSGWFSNWYQDYIKDSVFRRMMRSIGKSPGILASQVEGTFYPTAEFGRFAESYLKHAWQEFPFLPGYVHGRVNLLVEFLDKQQSPRGRAIIGRYSYPREEFYQPNYFSALGIKPAAPYCLMNWESNLTVTIRDIDSIRQNKKIDEHYEELFTVKRVDRRLDDSLRRFVATLSP